MIWVRSLAFNILFYGWTVLIGTLCLPVLLMPWVAVMRFGVFWARVGLWLTRVVAGLDHEIRGLDRIPPGASIIAMKHQSAWDTLVMPVLLANAAMVLKRELGYVPIYGWYAVRAGSIPIDRQGGAAAVRQMVAAAREAAAQGRPIVIFPEGTRTAPGTILPYQPGVAALYRALQVPVVPAAVNSGLFWGRRSFLKRPGRITLEFLDPIPPGLPRRPMMAELERRIETATAALIEEGERFIGGRPSPRPSSRLQGEGGAHDAGG